MEFLAFQQSQWNEYGSRAGVVPISLFLASIKECETVVGFGPNCEQPDSLSNFSGDSLSDRTGLGEYRLRPGIASSEHASQTSAYSDRTDKSRGTALRAAGADGATAGL